MTTRLSLLALAAALTTFASSAGAAPGVQVVPVRGGARLVVGGKLVAAFRAPNAGLPPVRRAELAEERLEELIRGGLSAQDVEVRNRGESWGVYAAGGLVMIATGEE